MGEKDLLAGTLLCLHQCDEEQCESGHSFGPAVRDHFLIHIILSGKGVFCTGGETHSLQAGQCFLIRPGERTFYQADTTDPWHYAWVGFNGRDAVSLLAACGFVKGVSVVSIGDVAEAKETLCRLRERYEQKASSLALAAEIYLFLDRLCNGKVRLSQGDNTFRRVEEYMARNYSYPVTVQSLARQVNLDRSQLFRVIKKETGLSPSRYIVDFRLRVSQQLLLETDLSITEVMLSSGFDDLSRFSRCFKQWFSVSPRQYRQEKRKEQGGENNEAE